MTGNLTVQTLVGINKAVNSAVGLSVGSDAASATSYGLEVTNNSSNTRFLVDGLGSQRFYGSDNAETARFTDGKLGIGYANPQNNSNTNSILTIGGGLGATGDFNSVTEIQLHTGNGTTVNTTAAMTIDASGNVGIGTTTPASFSNQTSLTVQGTSIGRVDVKGAGGAGGGALLAWSEGMALATNSNWPLEIGVGVSYITFKTSGAERMRIDSSGNVLVGTTSNNYNRGKFTVFGTPGNPATTGANADNVAIRVATTTGNSQSFDIGMYNTSPYGAWLQAHNSGALDSHSPIILNPNGGNVGIGVSDPDSKLEIKGAGGGTGLTFKTTDASSNETFYIQDGGGVGVRYYPLKVGIPSGTATATNAVFQVEEAGLLTVLTTGNVGVSKTAPSERFTVGGLANNFMAIQSTGDGQVIGYKAQYLEHGTLYGSFEYTTGDAQLYIKNNFVGNSGVYSDINFQNKTTSGVLTNRLKIKGSTGRVGIGTAAPI